MSRTPSRPRVSASLAAALGVLALACAAPSAIAAEPAPPPPPPPGLNLDVLGLVQVAVNPSATPGQTNVPIGVHLNVPSVLELKVDTGLGLTTPPGPGVELGAQVPVAVDLTTGLGGLHVDLDTNVDASLLNGQDLADVSANVDLNAETDLLGLDTELGASVAANAVVGPKPDLTIDTDLTLPRELENLINPAGSAVPPKPLPVTHQSQKPSTVTERPIEPPAPTPTPTAPPSPAPPVAQPEPTPPPIDPTPPRRPLAERPLPAPAPAVTPAASPVIDVAPSNPPTLDRLRDVAVAAGRSIWLPLGLMIALFAYLLGQRLLDGGAKLASAARSSTPDDEIIEL